MSAIKDIIDKGQPIPAGVTEVDDCDDTVWVPDTEPDRWRCPGTQLRDRPSVWVSTQYGPLTVTAVREPEPQRSVKPVNTEQCNISGEHPAHDWYDGGYRVQCKGVTAVREPEPTLSERNHAAFIAAGCCGMVAVHMADCPQFDAAKLRAAVYKYAPEPQQADVSALLDLVRQYGHESHKSGVAADQRDEEADDYHDGKARRLYDRIAALVPQQPVQARNGQDKTWWIHACGEVAPLFAPPAGEHHHVFPPCKVPGPWRPLLVEMAPPLEPRTWPAHETTHYPEGTLPQYVNVQGWGTYGRREDGLYANTDGYPDDVWRGHCLTFDALRALGKVTEAFDNEPGGA